VRNPTLSIVFLEQLAHKVKGWSIEIVATDLNDNSLAKCRDGVYSDYALRNTTREFRDRYFTPEEQLFRVRDEVRELIKFERLNLQDQAKILFMKGFDIIFCCNVLIYFDGASKRRTIEHFYNALLPSGYFFLGHSESLYGIEDRLRLVHFPNATAYYKTNPGEPGGDAQ
jgi:chemotaxis protein methyltransferase CheR